MNPELEEAEKKLRDGIIAYVRAAYKTVGSVEIADREFRPRADGKGNGQIDL